MRWRFLKVGRHFRNKVTSTCVEDAAENAARRAPVPGPDGMMAMGVVLEERHAAPEDGVLRATRAKR